jgi:radical SAM protein with 4Fe4S-binding SPASM domain
MDNTKYGFYGRLKKEFPSQINIDITEKCNYSCVHCQHREFVKSKHYHGTDMEKDIHTKLIQEVKKEGKNITQYLRYSSKGEPLLHPLAYDFIFEAIQNSGVPITLTSNGSCINHKKMEKLFDEGLYLIDISIDAYSPITYKKIRIGGDLIKVNDSVRKMIEYKKYNNLNTKIVVSYIEQPLNTHETHKFKKFWNDQDIDFVVIRKLHSNAGKIISVSNTLRSLSPLKRKPCIYPWERICINPDGTLHFCPASWTKEGYIGDFHETTIKEAWNGKIYHQLRDSHLSSSFTEFPMCAQCPDWINIQWHHEGKTSYAYMIEDFSKEGK